MNTASSFKRYPYLKVQILSLLALLIPPLTTQATHYTAISGTVMILNTYSGYKISDKKGMGVVVAAQDGRMAPFMGGMALPNSSSKYSCLLASSIREIDGWKGIDISNGNGIVGGLTGSITGAVYKAVNADERTQSTTFSGGISYDSRGFGSPLGGTTQSAADMLCGGAPLPYARNRVTMPDEESDGNKSGIFSGSVWIYVPREIQPGTYPLVDFGIVQGISISNLWNGYLPITTAADTVTVLPPPCTIDTQTHIVFDTQSGKSRTVIAPINFQCGDIESNTHLDAYLMAKAVSEIVSPTELSLQQADGLSSGGIVRGYLMEQESSNIAESCSDTVNSIFFDGRITQKLSTVNSGANTTKILAWQLCPSEKISPGTATGSIILDIAYK